ncbi:MAG: tetraacyldisaccharide 4-kinase [Betaproteobacteria bacterium]|nr:tetraacyldisaccharide 4-kinase [Betaproteobacteria bacterium]
MKHWGRRGAVAWLLWPASLLFLGLVLLRRLFYLLRILRSTHPGIPVIVVGNITVGGTGKTPLVIWMAEFLAKNGWTPGVVSRGYGGTAARKDASPRAATVASDPAEVGDEPILISRRAGCPVWVGADRVEVAAVLRREAPKVDILILDDGLQHYRIRRDLEIAVVDARGLGNGFLLPAGPLREPRWRLKTVDMVVENGKTMHLEGDTVHRMTDSRERQPLTAFKGQKVHAVAGVGDPNRFFLQLGKAGIKVVPHPFPDHHPFKPADLEFGDEAPVLMTEKDAVKLRSAPRANWWVLPVAAQLDPAFGVWLLGRLDGWRRSKTA